MGPVNPLSYGYIWILVATEYFTKWVEAVSLCKAMGGAVANFIKENIIVRFRVSHRIISDNGTPFVNSEVRKCWNSIKSSIIVHHPITLKEMGKWR